MTGFSVKELPDRSFGDRLREAREALGQSPEDVERAIHVSKKYVLALERNDFRALPEQVYARKFARALASHYGLDPAEAVDALLQEMTVVGGAEAVRHPVNFVEGRRLMAAPLLIKSSLVAAFFLAIAGYFGWSIRQILKPPKVVLYSPMHDQSFPNGRVPLEGATEPETDLTVNGVPVLIEADGSFKEILNLPPGVSSLRVAAKKKHSREEEILLQVIVEEPSAAASASSTGSLPEREG